MPSSYKYNYKGEKWNKLHPYWSSNKLRQGRMFGKLVTFAVGVYAGIFLDQRYKFQKKKSLETRMSEFEKGMSDVKENVQSMREEVLKEVQHTQQMIPKVDDPASMYQGILDYLEKHKKDD